MSIMDTDTGSPKTNLVPDDDNILGVLCLRKILDLRLPHRNDAKIAKICNLWTFWLVMEHWAKRLLVGF